MSPVLSRIPMVSSLAAVRPLHQMLLIEKIENTDFWGL
jgi:hypothetical protein